MNNLLARSLAGLLFLLFILALCLFLSAGSLAYWQAWVFLAVFGVCVTFVTVYLFRFDQALLTRRVEAGPGAEPDPIQKVIQSVAGLFFLLLFIVPGFDYRFHWSNVPLGVVVFSDVMVALGLFIVFLVFRENSYTSATVQVAAEQKVVSTGPYAIVRHPMYAGALLMLLFVPFALGSWVALPFVVPMFLVIGVRLLAEEKTLTKELPGYSAYCQQVRYHLLPFVW
jgi:protein-S-isoprenylcysteine O-methyltransferase Ste14